MLTADLYTIVVPTLGVSPVSSSISATIGSGSARGGIGLLGYRSPQAVVPMAGLAGIADLNPIPVGASLIGGSSGTPYTTTITAQGGTGSYAFAVTSGALPVGCSMTSGGVISGTPTVAATASFTVTVTDSLGLTGSQTFTITIGAPVSGGGQNFGMTN